LPPRMSFIVRRPMTRLDSTASIINEWNIAYYIGCEMFAR
jgi:hypothetical protein